DSQMQVSQAKPSPSPKETRNPPQLSSAAPQVPIRSPLEAATQLNEETPQPTKYRARRPTLKITPTHPRGQAVRPSATHPSPKDNQRSQYACPSSVLRPPQPFPYARTVHR